MTNHFQSAKRIVIKIGSSLLVDDSSGNVHQRWLDSLCHDVAQCRAAGQEVVLVSSGAIAIGRRLLGMTRKDLPLEQKQAAAATGQIRLAHAYQETLAKHDITIAQILLTLEDSERRNRYLNARNTLDTLLRLGVLPIINENDTVSTAEIRYGDNDRLSARVAQMIGADCLVLLSDIDGLYTADPRKDKKAQFIEEVTAIDEAITAMAGDSGTSYGSGGMKTKIAAANIVMNSGCKMVICNGHIQHPVAQLTSACRATWFLPALSPQRARKNWLAQHLKPKGQLVIDAGAEQALTQGKSLLAAGIIAYQGDFQKGDPVSVFNQANEEIARGLVNFPSYQIDKIKGQQSQAFARILGFEASAEVIHADDLARISRR